ncbi:MAG TPA: holdfast anchoring protein HfaA [Caulobacteraceae bacterium]|jgi:holdfast attachment protein HfaA|nr:holdfast anchoring protein HfaA [Caulobacteraceae bacterium]
MVDLTFRGKFAFAATALMAGLAITSAAGAQTMNANSAAYNAGYGRAADEENQPVNVSLRDANGNVTAVDGVIQVGEDQSVFSNFGVGGAADAVSGVSTSTNASVASSIQVVVTQGDRHSDQSNTGNVSAASTLSGGVSNVQ